MHLKLGSMGLNFMQLTVTYPNSLLMAIEVDRKIKQICKEIIAQNAKVFG